MFICYNSLCAPMTPMSLVGLGPVRTRSRHTCARSTSSSPCPTRSGRRGRPLFRSVGGALKVVEVRSAPFTKEDSGGARSCDFYLRFRECAKHLRRRRQQQQKSEGITYVPIIIIFVFETFFSNAWLNTTREEHL